MNWKTMNEKIAELEEERDQLKKWVEDLQSGMYINCVYCGHRYGPSDEVPASMAQVLKEHVESCPKHPMSLLKKENEGLKKNLREMMIQAWGCGYDSREYGKGNDLEVITQDIDWLLMENGK